MGLPDSEDEVDRIVGFWHAENPALDVAAKSVTLRLRRAAHLLDRMLRVELAAHGTETWELEMLLALRRAPGCTDSAGALQRMAQVTSGAITNRLDRLEANGWVTRRHDERDRRHVLVTLTDEGIARAGTLLQAKLLTEERFFAGVDRAVVDRLATDLRSLLGSLDDRGAPDLFASIADPVHVEPGGLHAGPVPPA